MVLSAEGSGISFTGTPHECGYLPVSSVPRAGVQTGVLATVLRNCTPSRANLSRLGVRTCVLPIEPRSMPRHWSGMMNKMFGGAGLGCAKAEAAAVCRNDRRFKLLFYM